MGKSQVNKMTRLFIVFALMLTLLAPALSPSVAHAASGTTYYISSSEGNDNNNGTSESSPWQSLDKVNSQKFQAGDKVLFKAGDVWNGSIKLRNTSGTKDAPIVFDKYGSIDVNVRPIINGNGTTTTEESAIVKNYTSIKDKTLSAVIDVVDGSYLQFHNFELTNKNPNVVSQRAGINIRTTSTNTTQWEANQHRGIVITNNYVHDVDGNPTGWKVGSGGILILGNITDVLIDSNIVKRVDIEGIRNAGLYKEGDIDANFPRRFENVIFSNNYVEDTQGDAFVMSNVGTNGRMEYNTVVRHSNKNVGNVNYAGLWVIGVKDMTIQYNEVYGGVFGYNDGQAFDIDMFSEGTLYQYNYSHSNRGGFILFMHSSTNSLVRYNVSVNDGDGRYIFHYLPTTKSAAPVIHNNTFFTDSHINTKLVSDPGKYLRMYNNIFYSKANTTFGQTQFAAGSEVKNNIFYPGNGYQDANLTNLSLQDNLFVSPQFARAGEEPKDIVGLGSFDVEKLNGYKLLSGSPAIDAGLDMSGIAPSVWSAATKDFFNNPLTDKVDIGAHEYSNDAPTNINPEVMPASITLDQSELVFTAAKYGATVKANVLPTAATFNGVKWSSSNPAIAAVDANGYVTAVSAGNAVITAESVVDSTVKATIAVTSVTPAAGHVLKMKFENNVLDESPYNIPLTSFNNLSYVKGPGIAGKAINLNPTESGQSYISAGKPSNLQFGANQNFTVSFWMKSDGQNGADTTIISNKDWASGANQGWIIGMYQGNLIWNYKGSSKDRLDFKPTVVKVGDNEWHHIAISHNRTGDAVFYVDNKQVKTISIANAGNIDTTLPINIGADGKGNLAYKGLLDEMNVYNTALSATEVATLYQSYFAQPGDRSVLQELIDEAQVVYDAAVEGTKPGQYPVAAKAELQKAIRVAQDVHDDQAAAPEVIDAAGVTLNRAVSVFETTIIIAKFTNYIIASDDALLSDSKNTVQLRIDGQMNDDSKISNPDYYKAQYIADHAGAVIDQETGKLTFNGDLSTVNEINVSAEIKEYTNLVYSESFEKGLGEFVTEQSPPTAGAGPVVTNKVSYHGNSSALYNEPPAIEKTFAPNQQGIVTMMLYDDGTKAGATRAVAHVGNLRTNLLVAMGVFYDGGSTGNKDNYSVRASNSATAWEDTGIVRTVGWHELKWDYTSGTDLKMYIDDQLVKTTTAIKSFDRINLAFVWDKANGRTFAFDNIKYAANGEKTTVTTDALKIAIDKPKALSTTLTGSKSVEQGSTFTVKYGLSDVRQSFYSQEITLNYDANLYEFTGVSSLVGDRITILQPDEQKAGEIRLVIASLGEGNEISADAEILGLMFKAKPLSVTKTGIIAITFAELGNAQGDDIVAELSSLSVEVTAKKTGVPGDLNNDEKVTVGDLAMIAAHYGKDHTDANWINIQQFDVNYDGKIDIEDLAIIAQTILLN
ncbi:LamG-like jellyroll fold domain-containing protein [Paenibacillus endoradicis]|uniref:LamG-like jellyroll fold domain-containing protein n=1 Tax=Paenibacillus endoradicis TaxID=2972487 RepID=UPI0021599880|nr:LamG-like jellyroll fold domain-containing protein [Paenibacillus endoradicis]MCR8660415.1 cohesin domain-containing protein [Paenibacillus endoradicis]